MMLNGHTLEAASLRDIIRLRASLGGKVAVVLKDETITFSALAEAANRVGAALQSLGVGKGQVVASYMHNSIDHIILWFGCAKIGAVWAPINIALINLDLAFTITEADARVVVVDHDLAANYEAIRDQVRRPDRIEVLRGSAPEPGSGWMPFSELLAASADEPAAEVGWSDPAGMIFTGGSTGMPKAVLVPNGWFFAGACRYREMFSPGADDVHLGIGPMYHAIGSAVDVFAPFYFGMTTVKMPWFSASQTWDIARKNNCTISCITGAAMLALLAQPERPNDGDNPLRIVAGGTGSIPPDAGERFKTRFSLDRLEIYGQTETGPLGCISQRTSDRPYHALGKGNGWVDIMVADDDDNACPPGGVGQILLRPRFPSTFMIGYHGRPEKVVESWRNLWFHTGDLGRLDANGYLHFEGRMAHLIRRRGENIAAIEVEKAILDNPAVLRCAVVGVPGDLGDEDVKVWLELRPGHSLEPLDVVKWCEERIAYFKVPRYVEFSDALPLSASKGEVERYKLAGLGVGAAWDRESIGYKVRRAGRSG